MRHAITISLVMIGCGGGESASTDSSAGKIDGPEKLEAAAVALIDGEIEAGGNTPLSDANPERDVAAALGEAGTAFVDSGTESGTLAVDAGPILDAATPVDAVSSAIDGIVVDAGFSVDGGASGNDCIYPQCYAELLDIVRRCLPTGACVKQDTGMPPNAPTSLAGSYAYCFENGVKEYSLWTMDSWTTLKLSYEEQWKNGSSRCYERSRSQGVTRYHWSNGDGSAFASFSIDSAANTTTITCAAGASTKVPTGCLDPLIENGADKPDQCIPGSCVF